MVIKPMTPEGRQDLAAVIAEMRERAAGQVYIVNEQVVLWADRLVALLLAKRQSQARLDLLLERAKAQVHWALTVDELKLLCRDLMDELESR